MDVRYIIVWTLFDVYLCFNVILICFHQLKHQHRRIRHHVVTKQLSRIWNSSERHQKLQTMLRMQNNASPRATKSSLQNINQLSFTAINVFVAKQNTFLILPRLHVKSRFVIGWKALAPSTNTWSFSYHVVYEKSMLSIICHCLWDRIQDYQESKL